MEANVDGSGVRIDCRVKLQDMAIDRQVILIRKGAFGVGSGCGYRWKDNVGDPGFVRGFGSQCRDFKLEDGQCCVVFQLLGWSSTKTDAHLKRGLQPMVNLSPQPGISRRTEHGSDTELSRHSPATERFHQNGT